MKTKKFNFRIVDIALLVVLFALVFLADLFLPSYDIKFKVLQKGAVFALVAVSIKVPGGE